VGGTTALKRIPKTSGTVVYQTNSIQIFYTVEGYVIEGGVVEIEAMIQHLDDQGPLKPQRLKRRSVARFLGGKKNLKALLRLTNPLRDRVSIVYERGSARIVFDPKKGYLVEGPKEIVQLFFS
jgi:hypothetical protein